MIVYEKLSKNYGELKAVEDLNLHIEKGSFFGLLGPNGAGKTTTIRMTTSLTPPSAGRILVDGLPVSRDNAQVKRRLGVVPQDSTLERELTAWENLEYHGRLYGMPRARRRARIQELLEFAELSDRAKDLAYTFSGGMQRRLMIVKALMHEPAVLLLDEPTVGLDAAARRRIWDFLRVLKEQGLTIFLTTHYLEEAETLCDRIGMMHQGHLVSLGSPAEIVGKLGSFVLEHFEGGQTRRDFFPNREEAEAAAEGLGCEYRIRPANLEDAFVRLTNRGLTE